MINVTLAGSGAEPSSRNLCEALRKKLLELHLFSHPDKEVRIDAYNRMLGIPGANLVWTYLNKGAHEEANRDDFDSAAVESIVVTLEELAQLPLRRGR